jgi:hypothetical protein
MPRGCAWIMFRSTIIGAPIPVSDPAAAANQFYNFLKATYDRVKRPLWITEWNNGANWTGCGDPSFAQQQAAINAMIDMLDSTPFVERYAPYNWVEDVRRLKWDDGSLTSAGTTYRDQVSPIGYVQTLPSNGTRSFSQLRFENNLRDSSGYANNGIGAGRPAYTNGVTGQALVFDGATTVVTLPQNVATGNAFTFAGGSNGTAARTGSVSLISVTALRITCSSRRRVARTRCDSASKTAARNPSSKRPHYRPTNGITWPLHLARARLASLWTE